MSKETSRLERVVMRGMVKQAQDHEVDLREAKKEARRGRFWPRLTLREW